MATDKVKAAGPMIPSARYQPLECLAGSIDDDRQKASRSRSCQCKAHMVWAYRPPGYPRDQLKWSETAAELSPVQLGGGNYFLVWYERV